MAVRPVSVLNRNCDLKKGRILIQFGVVNFWEKRKDGQSITGF